MNFNICSSFAECLLIYITGLFVGNNFFKFTAVIILKLEYFSLTEKYKYCIIVTIIIHTQL